MPFMGFSINLLTLFGPDSRDRGRCRCAIVIVENASHHIERGEAPREATIRAMGEVTGPVISITLVLMAVFIPTAFLSGITGQMYRQFALTIAATALISAINALTLKPAQCAQWLRPVQKKGRFSRAFDAVYKPIERGYSWSVTRLVSRWWIVLLVFVGVALATAWWYQRTPTGFLPEEDQGYIIIAVQLPDSASLDRTSELVERLNTTFRDTPGVQNWFVLGGFSLLEGTASPNGATVFVAWKDWKERTTPQLQQSALFARLEQELKTIPDAEIRPFIPPSIQGLGMAGGFQMQIEDREGVGLELLQERTQAIMFEVIRRQPDSRSIKPPTAVESAFSLFRAACRNPPRHRSRESGNDGVKVDDIFSTLQANLGSVYVNDFNKFSRTYQVRIRPARPSEAIRT